MRSVRPGYGRVVPRARSRRIARPAATSWLLAAVATAGLVGAWGAAIDRAGRDARDDVLAAARDLVRDTRPDVVVLGNSAARFGIDPDGLADALGLDVVALTRPASGAATWTALLRHAVRDVGATPDLVVVASPTRAALADRVTEAGARRDLAALLGPGDADLATALGDAAWDRIAPDGATALRVTTLGALARWGAWALDGAPGLDPVDAWPAAADPEDGHLPALRDAIHALGARWVLVLMPIAPARRARLDPPEEAHRLIAWARDAGAGVVDLRDLPLPAAAWRDAAHLGPAGRDAVTDALSDALRGAVDHDTLPAPAPRQPARAIGTTGWPDPPAGVADGPCVRLDDVAWRSLSPWALARAGLPIGPPVIAVDAEGTLPWIGPRNARDMARGVTVTPSGLRACSDTPLRWTWAEPVRDGPRWVAPGAQLRVELDGPDRSPWRIALAMPTGDPTRVAVDRATALVTRSGRRAMFDGVGGRDGHDVTVRGGDGWTVVVALHASGSAVLGGALPDPAHVDLLDTRRTPARARVRGPLPAAPVPLRDGIIGDPALRDLALATEALGLRRGCLPIVAVDAAGAPLAGDRATRWRASAAQIRFDGLPPGAVSVQATDDGTLARCRAGRWLAPGRTLRLDLAPPHPLLAGIDRLDVDVRAAAPTDAVLEVSTGATGTPHPIEAGRHTIPVGPLAPDAGVEVWVRAPADGPWWWLAAAVLHEPAP